MKVLIINGPSLNLLGIRETKIYGEKSYKQLTEYIKSIAKLNAINVRIVQSNCEGKIIDYIQSGLRYDGIIINAGGYTHTSIAIADAIRAINKPVIEVHLSDINNREEFRKNSYLTDCCVKTYMGKGFESYKEALLYFVEGE